MATRAKRPRDPNQLAKLIADISIGDTVEADPDANKDPKAIERGRLGGVRGGTARAASLSREKRQQIATKAARARWAKKV